MSLVVKVVWAWNIETGNGVTFGWWGINQTRTRTRPLYLHAGAVGFAAYQSGRDVGVCELVVQVDHVRHPARQEELVSLALTGPEHHAVDVPTWGEGGAGGLSAEFSVKFSKKIL